MGVTRDSGVVEGRLVCVEVAMEVGCRNGRLRAARDARGSRRVAVSCTWRIHEALFSFQI